MPHCARARSAAVGIDGMQRGQRDRATIDFEERAQRSTRVRTSEAVGAERDVAIAIHGRIRSGTALT